MDTQLKILVIDANLERAEVLLSGLDDVGYALVEHLQDMTNLVQRIAVIDPDVILIDLENPNRNTVGQMFRVSQQVKRPIAMFVDESDQATTTEAVRAGVSAYIIDGLRRERIRPIVEVAISRFQTYHELEQRAHDAEMQLTERKTIERARALLMKKRQLPEAEAYDTIRRMAREKGKRMYDVAESIVTAHEMGI